MIRKKGGYVTAINHDTGQYQNYQLKFGKDAKATIDLLERGNYNNQRVVVPSEQLEEVQEYFKEKGIHVKILDIPTTLTEFPPEQMWVMDMINAILIEAGISQKDRLIKLNEIAIHQMVILEEQAEHLYLK